MYFSIFRVAEYLAFLQIFRQTTHGIWVGIVALWVQRQRKIFLLPSTTFQDSAHSLESYIHGGMLEGSHAGGIVVVCCQPR